MRLFTIVCLLTFVACTAQVTPNPLGGQPPAPLPTPVGPEVCGDGLDNDADGVVDNGCNCAAGQTQSCFPFPPQLDGIGACARGTQQCIGGDGELGNGTWGPCEGAVGPEADTCEDGVDSDCDGVDPSCGAPPPGLPPDTVEVPLFFIGDCVTAACPTATPYPVGCEVLFSPGDNRGCVASQPMNSIVYFQAGDECDKGLVGGRLYCSATPGAALDASTCSINKPVPIYATSPTGCPDTH